MKKPPLDNAYIVKYIRPSLKNKKLLMSLKDLCINSLNNTMKLATVSRDLTAPLKKRMQHFFKKDFSKKDLSFLINRTGRRVTKLYWHYAFEQERFKKLHLMNQRSRQNGKNSIEKDFYKLMNNTNFGYDCRNNLDNCQFILIFDEMNEVTYWKRYYNYFSEVSKFVSSDLIRAKVKEKYIDSSWNCLKIINFTRLN